MIAVLFCSPLFMPLLYLGVIQVSTKKTLFIIFFVETLQSILDASDQAFVVKRNRTHPYRVSDNSSLDYFTSKVCNICQVVVKNVQEWKGD